VRSVLLQTITRLAYPGIITFSLFMFFRGHNHPGGGFIGGLIASAGILLTYIAFGMWAGDRIYGVHYRTVALTGLLCAVSAGMLPMLMGKPFLTSMFGQVVLPFFGEVQLSTVLLFDFGVFLVVLGTILGIVKVLVMERKRVPNFTEESD